MGGRVAGRLHYSYVGSKAKGVVEVAIFHIAADDARLGQAYPITHISFSPCKSRTYGASASALAQRPIRAPLFMNQGIGDVSECLCRWMLNDVDKNYKIKQKVIDALKTVPDHAAQGIYVINTQSESWLQQVSAKGEATGTTIHQSLMDWLGPICRKY